MKYTKYDMDGFTLYSALTDRFKTIGFRINIRVLDKKEYGIYYPLLTSILSSTSKKYKSIKEINMKCASIYDPYYSIRSIQSGSEVILSLSSVFTNEKYTENGMNEEIISFLSDFLLNPKVENGKFDEEQFEIKKIKLLESYYSLKDHPKQYADCRLEEEMMIMGYKDYSLEEVISETEKVTNEDLYNFYKTVMSEGKLDVFVCGNYDASEMKNIISKNIRFKGNRNGKINHVIKQTKFNKKPNIVTEKSNNVQSNLVIGCKVIGMSEDERRYSFLLYSWILGGGMNCLLNKTVREENSLCYYIYASRKSLFGVMKIYAGINGKDFDKVYKLIVNEMNNMKNGKFSDELFEGVKQIYYNSLLSTEDYQEDMLGSIVSQVYMNDDDIDNRREKMKCVTKEDIVKFARKVYVDTVYLLKGDDK